MAARDGLSWVRGCTGVAAGLCGAGGGLGVAAGWPRCGAGCVSAAFRAVLSSLWWSMSQFLDTVIDMPVIVHVVFVVLKAVEVPQLQYLHKVVDVFFVQLVDGYGRFCDHAATSGPVEGASDSFHRQSQWTFQFHRDGYAFSVGLVAMKVFSAFFWPFFALLRVVPALSASCWSPRW